MMTPRDFATGPVCPNNDHDVREKATQCGRCGVPLCEVCMSDEHWTADGHDLSHPRYWGV